MIINNKQGGTLGPVFVLFFFLLITAGNIYGQVASRNDHIFPSAQQAKPYIDYDARGFLINGKRTFIASAGMEYARVPRTLWHDRLLRLKRAGFNAIEMYTFWNFHEAREGRFNFTGDHDLNAYLKMIKAMGMYAIVRVGPYYCGEWNMGGYPIWLKFKPGMRVREDNPRFLTAVDKFFDKLIPIVSQNQVNHGGSVILVQLENEHRAAWGTVTPNNYFRHLITKTVSLGLEVPYFFSGLHSGNDPAGDAGNLDDPKRPNPWFSTEYWGVWFLNYGPQDQDSTIYDRRTWKIIAHGGNGYNVYMAHGGTNFDYNNDRDNAASYDYGAAVGQTGDLRPLYYSFKRANWFARSFPDVLANSLNEQANKPAVTDTNIKVTQRKSPAGTIAFLDNQDSVTVAFNLTPSVNNPIQATTPLKLAAGEIMPIVQNYPLTPQIKLAWAPTRIYSIIPQGNTTTLLIYGDTGSKAQLFFEVPKEVKITQGQGDFNWADGRLNFNATISSTPMEYSFEAGGKSIRIIAVNSQLATRAWYIANDVIVGPQYACDLIPGKNTTVLAVEQPWVGGTNTPTWVFKPTGPVIKINPVLLPARHLTKLKLGAWQVKDAAWQARLGIDDSEWLTSKDPLQMGADGDITAHAWYRTKIKVDESGDYTLQFKNIRDRAALFIDGQRIDTGAVFNKTVKLHLNKGTQYLLALFTAHDGRNKLIFRVGEIDTIDAKGLSGPVSLQKTDGRGPVRPVINWRMQGGEGQCDSPLEREEGSVFGTSINTPLQPHSLAHSLSRGELYTVKWQPLPVKQNNTPHIYRTTLNLPTLKNSNIIWRVNTTSLSYGSVWVNGHNLGRYPEKIKIGGLYIPSCWLKPGSNSLVIYEENGVLPTKVSIAAEMAASRDTQILQF